MNLVGYYSSNEVWIPDPISETQEYSKKINQYVDKNENKEKEVNN